uniref:Uncharacterized protein n=1 Tax=Quercus lobata TaxID=97700 RepID=A0A7N2RB14_QUELO
MKREVGVPDSYTYPSIIKARSTQCEVSLGSALHGSALRCEVEGDLFVRTTLIDFYGKYSYGCRVCNCCGHWEKPHMDCLMVLYVLLLYNMITNELVGFS